MTTTCSPAAYTILLSRPDWIANDNLDTYFTTVWGATVEAATADGLEECDLEECDLDGYAVLLVIAGDHEDLNPER